MLDPNILRLVAITDDAEDRRATLVDRVTAAVRGGATSVQVRLKSATPREVVEITRSIISKVSVPVIVNDRADIARLSGADGVHLGQDDLGPAAARAIVGHDAIVGLSTHTRPQLDAALREPVTYIAIGPVFGTSTKATGYTAAGLDAVRYAAQKVRLKPDSTYDVVAIGGITLESAAHVIEAGATSVAVIADLLATNDPEARVRAYLARLGETGNV